MARQNYTPYELTVNAGGTTTGTINQTDGHRVVPAKAGRIFIHVTNGGTVNGTVYVQPGTSAPAFRRDGGTLSAVVPGSGETFLVVESAKYAQADGSYNVDFNTGMTGNFRVYQLPDDL